MLVVIRRRQSETEACISERVLGVAAVDLITRVLRLRAQILALRSAEIAEPPRSSQPGDSDPLAWCTGLNASADLFNPTDDLMAGHDWDLGRWQIAVDDVQVRAADAAGQHAHQHLPGPGTGISSSTAATAPSPERVRAIARIRFETTSE